MKLIKRRLGVENNLKAAFCKSNHLNFFYSKNQIISNKTLLKIAFYFTQNNKRILCLNPPKTLNISGRNRNKITSLSSKSLPVGDVRRVVSRYDLILVFLVQDDPATRRVLYESRDLRRPLATLGKEIERRYPSEYSVQYGSLKDRECTNQLIIFIDLLKASLSR